MGNRQRLERDTLLSSMADRAAQYKTLETQFIQLRESFQTIVNLEGFTGLGASSIKRFFQAQIDVVDAWLLFIEVQMTFLNDVPQDRKSTRLNSSHVAISYAVFCLEKITLMVQSILVHRATTP